MLLLATMVNCLPGNKNVGESGSAFPKLPGLVIKGQGDNRMPVSNRDKKLAQQETSAYALSPKMVQQLRIEEKL